MNLKLIRDCDRILINCVDKDGKRTFLNKAINYFMDKYRQKYGVTEAYLKIIDNGWTASHAATCHWIGNVLYVFESVEKGYKPRIFIEHYNPERDDYIVLRNTKPVTEWDRDRSLRFGLNLVEKSVFYEYWGLLYWIILIWLGIDLFGKGGSDNTYCYEGAYREAKHIFPKDFPGRSERTSFFDLFGPNDEIVIDHRR